MDRLFDRFGSGFGFPSLRRMFDVEPPAWRSSFSFSTPAIDMSEDEKAYKIMAELPGMDVKDIGVQVTGDTLVLKGEKRQETEEKDKNYHFSSVPTAPFSAPSSCRPASTATRSPPIFRRGCSLYPAKDGRGAKAGKEDRRQVELRPSPSRRNPGFLKPGERRHRQNGH
jgi:Hsp20/alpha crystallin family